MFRCPRQACGRTFIGQYKRIKNDANGNMFGDFHLRGAVPATVVPPDIPQEVLDVSPVFGLVYSQSIAAEAGGLDQIAGGGYRKALEFLVKDYCISLEPQHEEAIRKEFLGATIKKRVKDPQVQAVATRAAWLGNDETHYSRKWGDKDINDLKVLIDLTMSWIHSSVLTAKYIKEMPEASG